MIALLLGLAWMSVDPAPPMLSRAEWGAREPVLAMKPHARKLITLHHGGVPAKPDVPTATKIKNLQTWSQREDKLASGKTKPAWPDVPYHYWIGYDGVIAVARDDAFAGDTNTEYDPTGHVLVCLEGDFQSSDPTEAQLKSMRSLVLYLAVKYQIPTAGIQTHRDYSKETTCPGDRLYRLMDDLRWHVLRNRTPSPSKKTTSEEVVSRVTAPLRGGRLVIG